MHKHAHTVLALTVGSMLGLGVASTEAAGLYFTQDGDDLVITAKEALGPTYWSMNLAGAVSTPASGPVGAITEFYDLTGDTGSNPAFNIARGTDGLLYTAMDAGATTSGLSLTSVGTLSAPSFASLTDGASSYTFSLNYQFSDYLDVGAATFTSVITINAPTQDGTRFDVLNTLTTSADWNMGSSLAQGGRASRSRLASDVQAMTGATLDSFDGWTADPKDPNQNASKEATGSSTGYAEGRTFLLSQTTDLESSEVNTASLYIGVVNTEDEASLHQMFSGTFRGHAPTDWTGSSVGFLDINITAIPEPASLALFGAGFFLMTTRSRRTEE